jgi:thiamine phosphate synthase YjbQ (UPF0047 family)
MPQDAGAVKSRARPSRIGTWQSIALVDLNVDNPDREVRLSFLG